MLKYTKFGRSIYAVGGSQQSALMLGLDVRKVKLKAYVLDGFLCGSLGHVLFCLNTLGGFVEQAKGFEMDAIASSVIGGTLLTGGVGNVVGTLFGVVIKATDRSIYHLPGNIIFLVDAYHDSSPSLLLYCASVQLTMLKKKK